MKDGGTTEGFTQGGTRILNVRRLASDVISVLAERTADHMRPPSEDVLNALIVAATSVDHAALSDLVVSLRRDRISAEVIADVYVPEAARRLGEDWHQDRRGFAEVTIGTSRLQSMLRQIGTDWGSGFDGGGTATVLMLVPEMEDHTLGAVVATGQLRRRGISVALRLKERAADIAGMVAAGSYDGIMISWSSTDRLETLAKIVAVLREASGASIPIFIGGNVVELVEDAKEKTGADFATNDLSLVASQLDRSRAGTIARQRK